MNSYDRKRDRILRQKFSISIENYNQLLVEQDGVCYICQSTDDFSEFLAVDHCHQTGKVRGLLCRNCNRALGQFYDNVEFLERAIGYLKRPTPNFELNEMPPIKEHNTRPRYRCIVQSPDGKFDSYMDAAKFYKVHETTIRQWCTVSSKFHKEGFSMNKIFGVIGDG